MGHQCQRWPRMSFFGISADELMDCSHLSAGRGGNWPHPSHWKLANSRDDRLRKRIWNQVDFCTSSPSKSASSAGTAEQRSLLWAAQLLSLMTTSLPSPQFYCMFIHFKAGSVTSNRRLRCQFEHLRSNISAVTREQQWKLSLSLLFEMALQGISFSRIGCNAALITRKTAVIDPTADSAPWLGIKLGMGILEHVPIVF